MANWILIKKLASAEKIFKKTSDHILRTKEVNRRKTCFQDQKRNSKAFDNATQPQKPHWKSLTSFQNKI